MKNLIRKIGIAVMLVPIMALGVGLVTPATTHAAECGTSTGLNGAIGGDDSCTGKAAKSSGQQTGSLFGEGSIVTNVINIMLFIVGILCVVMIIFSGIRYVISNGKSDQVKSAKDTLMYAIVGLIIAIIAYALVNWVFTSIGNPT